MASVQTQVHVSHEIDTKQGDKAQLKVQYGDFSADLAKVVKALEEVCQFLIPFYLPHIDLLGKKICCEQQSNEDDRGLHQIVSVIVDYCSFLISSKIQYWLYPRPQGWI